jgi:hypothetical protein
MSDQPPTPLADALMHATRAGGHAYKEMDRVIDIVRSLELTLLAAMRRAAEAEIEVRVLRAYLDDELTAAADSAIAAHKKQPLHSAHIPPPI